MRATVIACTVPYYENAETKGMCVCGVTKCMHMESNYLGQDTAKSTVWNGQKGRCETSNGKLSFKTLVLIAVSITKRSGVMTVRVDDFRPAVDIDSCRSPHAAGQSCSFWNRSGPNLKAADFK